MPDRAVVGDDAREQEVLERLKGPWHGWHTCGNCGKLQTVYCQNCGELLPEGEAPAPRALVAISEDRQWLVVLETIDQATGFAVYRFVPEWLHSWRFQDTVEDTGQSAEDVLREWMEGRDGSEATEETDRTSESGETVGSGVAGAGH